MAALNTLVDEMNAEPLACRLWLVCGITGNILASANVSSIADTGTGIVTVTIDVDFGSANYALVANANHSANKNFITISSIAAGSFVLNCYTDAGSLADPTTYRAVAFGT